MSSSYPAALDSVVKFPQTIEDDTDSTSGNDLGQSSTVGFLAQWMRDTGDALVKIETELGTNPKGLYAANVRERFEIAAYKNQSVRVASTANIAGTYGNGTLGVGANIAVGGTTLTIDGVALANGDRVLLKDQTAPANNGIYTVSGVGTAVVLTRAIDADTSAKIGDCKVLVNQGTQHGDTEWQCTATNPVIGTTTLPFKRSNPFYGHGNPRFPWEPGASMTAFPVMATLPRIAATSTLTLTATQLQVGGIVVPAGRTVTNINTVFTGVGSGTVTIFHFALVRQLDRVVMAHTANSTSFPVANAIHTRALTATWTPDYDTPVWVLMSQTFATTYPAVMSTVAPTVAAVNAVAPAIAGTNGIASSATLPTNGTTVITAVTTGTAIPYIWLT